MAKDCATLKGNGKGQFKGTPKGGNKGGKGDYGKAAGKGNPKGGEMEKASVANAGHAENRAQIERMSAKCQGARP